MASGGDESKGSASTGGTPEAPGDAAAVLRARMMAISQDTTLSREQKTRALQDLMTEKWRAAQVSSVPVEVPSETFETSYHNRDKSVYGCAHYQRKCQIMAPCCGKWFPCRLCHDEKSDHQIDRYAVTEIGCAACKLRQPVQKNCETCGNEFARYFCAICKFFDDDPNKSIYHCVQCGLCRKGQGLGIDFFHCERCNMCMAIALRDNHVCIENKMESNCPVCHEFMFTSVKTVTILKCGHCMHEQCYGQYLLTNYVCPLCSRSVVDMTQHWRQLDALVALQPMPEEFRETTAKILCNDCHVESTVPFHFAYHRCANCGGYNTRVLGNTNMPTQEAMARAADTFREAQLARMAAGGNGDGEQAVLDLMAFGEGAAAELGEGEYEGEEEDDGGESPPADDMVD